MCSKHHEGVDEGNEGGFVLHLEGELGVSGRQWVSAVVSGRQWVSAVVSGRQRSSVVVWGRQWTSAVISGRQRLSGLLLYMYYKKRIECLYKLIFIHSDFHTNSIPCCNVK